MHCRHAVAGDALHGPLLRPLPLPASEASHGLTLWLVDLAFSSERLDAFFHRLDEGERHRFHRYRCARARYRFAACRSALRHLLASTVDAERARHPLVCASRGKPGLPGSRGPFFNVSHSHERGCIALSARHEVGVDIEAHALDIPFDAIAQQFSERERRFVHGGGASRFYEIWTRKEAVLKACGSGLGVSDLRGFCVTPRPHAPTWTASGGARLASVEGVPGYSLAVATVRPALVNSNWRSME